MKIRHLNSYIAIFCVILFVFITFPKMINHYPSYDEAWNYCVSRYMKLQDYNWYLAQHGHTIIWYLLIMPFAKLNIAYPYPMLIINWFFAVMAIFVLWIKAPFNNFFKIIITFSYMMLHYFSIFARCYSIGIFGLFCVASLYKNQIKRPILYAVLLGLSANTSAMASILVLPLALIFINNLIKNFKMIDKKILFVSIGILILCGGITLYPCIRYSIFSNYTTNDISIYFERFCIPQKWTLIAISSYVFSFGYLFFKSRNKAIKFFLVFSTCFLIIFLFRIYIGMFWHRFFFIIILIITMWINNDIKIKNKLFVIFSLSMLLLLSVPVEIGLSGDEIEYKFGKEFQKNNWSNKFHDCILLVSGYEMQPFLMDVEKNSVQILLYSYGELNQIIANNDKPIYLIINKSINHFDMEPKDLTKFEDKKTDSFQNQIFIYKLK